MPNFLRLKDKETGVAYEGRDLIAVDEKLCEALGVPCSEEHFYLGWVDWDGLYLTNDWNKVKEWYKESERAIRVIEWLEKNYSLDSYAMMGRCS